MMRTKMIEDQLRQGRFDAKTLDSMFRRRIEEGANCSPFVSQAIPALAGFVAGTTVGRRLGPEDGGSLVAAASGLVTGVGLGLTSAALVAVAAGSLGTGAMASVGAPAVATGVAVAAQSAVAAALAAAVVRWRSRG